MLVKQTVSEVVKEFCGVTAEKAGVGNKARGRLKTDAGELLTSSPIKKIIASLDASKKFKRKKKMAIEPQIEQSNVGDLEVPKK